MTKFIVLSWWRCSQISAAMSKRRGMCSGRAPLFADWKLIDNFEDKLGPQLKIVQSFASLFLFIFPNQHLFQIFVVTLQRGRRVDAAGGENLPERDLPQGEQGDQVYWKGKSTNQMKVKGGNRIEVKMKVKVNWSEIKIWNWSESEKLNQMLELDWFNRQTKSSPVTISFVEVWEEKYIPAEEVEGFVEDCKTTGEEYKQVMLTLTRIENGADSVGADADCYVDDMSGRQLCCSRCDAVMLVPMLYPKCDRMQMPMMPICRPWRKSCIWESFAGRRCLAKNWSA